MLSRRVLAQPFCKQPQNARLSVLSPSLQSQESAVRLVPLIKPQTQEKGACLQGHAQGLLEGLFAGQ